MFAVLIVHLNIRGIFYLVYNIDFGKLLKLSVLVSLSEIDHELSRLDEILHATFNSDQIRMKQHIGYAF